MGVFGRAFFAFAVISTVTVVGVVLAQVSGPLLEFADKGDLFTPLMEQIQTLWPILLSVIILGAVAYVILGGVQREKSVQRRPRR
jgi:hypothetical protein